MNLLALVILLLLLPLCSFVPGFFILRRLRWAAHEKLCGAIALSLITIYLAATVIFLTKINWQCAWVLTLACGIGAVLQRREMWRFLRKKAVRGSCLAFGMVFGCGFLVQARHYAGGMWGTDWLEHFQRTLFFLMHLPWDSEFIGLYLLPARPPMTHLITAYFLGQSAGGFEHFQIIFLFLNALAFFPCILIAECIAPFAGRRSWLIAGFLVTCPMVIENITYTWNKQAAAFFVLCSVAFYLRGWRRGDAGRMVMSAVSMAAAILTHYSAGPYAVFLAAHYVLAVPKNRKALLYGGAAAGLLATWFGWSLWIYGAVGTFMTNTTATDSGNLSPIENVLKVISNIYCTFIPHPFRVTFDKFGVVFDQPNRFGFVRDYCFYLFQPNLLLSLGLLGWVVVFWLAWNNLRKADSPTRRFWIWFVIVLVILGIAAHGAPDLYGVAHICLQPLSLIGRVLLAAGFVSLRPRVRLILVLSIVADVVLGIILQCRMQMLSIRAFTIGEAKVVPLSRGLLSFNAVMNSTLRDKHSVTFLADQLSAASPVILLALILFFGFVLMLLANMARSGIVKSWRRPGPGSLAVLSFYGLSAIACVSDHKMGFLIADDTAPPTFDAAMLQRKISPLRERLRTEPESAEVYESLGIAYYESGQLDPAKENFENALLLNPGLVGAHYDLGLMETLNNIQMRPNDPILLVIQHAYRQDARSYVDYGALLYSRGFRKKGLETLGDAAKRFPNDWATHQAFALVLSNEGKMADAIEQTAAALRLNPDSTQLADQLRRMLRDQGESPDSIERKIVDLIRQK